MSCPAVAVIGIGSALMGDDGVGPRVISVLEERGVKGAMFVCLDSAGPALLTYFHQFRTVIIVDAADFHGIPGEVRRAEADKVRFETGGGEALSLHEMGLAAMLDQGRRLKILPNRVILYCVQAVSMDPLSSLSEPVEAAVDSVASWIEKEIASCTNSP